MMQSKLHLHDSTILIFHKLLHGKPENGLYPVVRSDTDEGLFLTPFQYRFFVLLREGHTIHTARKQLDISFDEAKINIEAMAKSGFISHIDSREIRDQFIKIKPLWPFISREKFLWTISKPFFFISFVFILSGFILILKEPAYIPTLSNLFWTDDLFLIQQLVLSLELHQQLERVD